MTVEPAVRLVFEKGTRTKSTQIGFIELARCNSWNTIIQVVEAIMSKRSWNDTLIDRVVVVLFEEPEQAAKLIKGLPHAAFSEKNSDRGMRWALVAWEGRFSLSGKELLSPMDQILEKTDEAIAFIRRMIESSGSSSLKTKTLNEPLCAALGISHDRRHGRAFMAHVWRRWADEGKITFAKVGTNLYAVSVPK